MRIPQSKQDKGFTLIELLVVVVIIGILAAVAIPVFLNQRQKAVDSGLKSDLKNAATAIESYVVDNPQVAIPGDTATDGGSGTTVLTDFNASPGNIITVTAGTAIGSYKITGENASSSEGADNCLTYDSEAGGLQPGWVAC
ncbi:prepilin-type N-terminal cleavage/methylation domain-containing protein [Nocardioides marinus]|uniref:Type IV pilus assembly protein PilA n=1 Tax=Nocardioides marinus TaxID=374514 RepID=A0A7Y9YFT1_9ACTN|nr:prepilin-type N-terminal cleavage/methylation domain-containing protein [Nocardioides marinus]NYI11421.1 type IV pilus assembly protein PilA [Nocardioides marinus]